MVSQTRRPRDDHNLSPGGRRCAHSQLILPLASASRMPSASRLRLSEQWSSLLEPEIGFKPSSTRPTPRSAPL